MHSCIAFLGLASVVAPSLAAQSAWVVEVAVQRHDQADALASPLRYGGLAPSFSLAGHHDGRTLSGISLAFSPARLTTRLSGPDTHSTDAWGGEVAGRWLRRVAEGGAGTVHLGPRLDVVASVRQQTYRPDVATELYGDIIAGLEVAGAWTWRPAVGHALRQQLSTPLFSAALRTPYTGAKFMPPLLLGGPGRLVGVRYEVEYTRDVSGTVALGSRYVFRTFRYPDPRSFSVVQHRLGAVVHFGGGTPR